MRSAQELCCPTSVHLFGMLNDMRPTRSICSSFVRSCRPHLNQPVVELCAGLSESMAVRLETACMCRAAFEASKRDLPAGACLRVQTLKVSGRSQTSKSLCWQIMVNAVGAACPASQFTMLYIRTHVHCESIWRMICVLMCCRRDSWPDGRNRSNGEHQSASDWVHLEVSKLFR